MIELLIPWALCVLFIIVALGIFLDSRYTERQVDKEWQAIAAVRAETIEREKAAQEIVNEARKLVESYRTKLIQREERIEELDAKVGDLNEILLSYRRREQRG